MICARRNFAIFAIQNKRSTDNHGYETRKSIRWRGRGDIARLVRGAVRLNRERVDWHWHAPQASRYIRLGQAERSETEEKTERKVTESTDNPAMPPNVTVVAPGTAVVAPAAPPVVTMPRTEEHVERKDVQKRSSTDALGMNSSSQRQMDKSSTDINADGSVQQNEERVTKEKTENND